MKILLPTFSEIMNENMQTEVKANRRLMEGIEDKTHVTMRTIQRYRSGERVPDLLTAKYILNFLRINLDEDELCEILSHSQNESKKIRNTKKETLNSISINLENIDLGIDIDPVAKNQIIDDRIYELFKDSGSLKKYIETLISKDLNDHIL